MWDLPRPGLEPVSPALAGRFSTTAPPGKPYSFVFNNKQNIKDYFRKVCFHVLNVKFSLKDLFCVYLHLNLFKSLIFPLCLKDKSVRSFANSMEHIEKIGKKQLIDP